MTEFLYCTMDFQHVRHCLQQRQKQSEGPLAHPGSAFCKNRKAARSEIRWPCGVKDSPRSAETRSQIRWLPSVASFPPGSTTTLSKTDVHTFFHPAMALCEVASSYLDTAIRMRLSGSRRFSRARRRMARSTASSCTCVNLR